jgi:precorrin-3B synthase
VGFQRDLTHPSNTAPPNRQPAETYSRQVPTREHPVDACPGALQVHQAADGGLARIRVPGGRLTAAAFRVVVDAAGDLGDGSIELTSRANLQVRGLASGTPLGSRLASVGLLPSATHERVRNIIASPLGSVRELVTELDRALCARPELAALPGRFLFAVDSGRGDVAWLDADVAALFVETGVAILLGGVDVGLRVAASEVPATMLACASAFLSVRTEEWRIGELTSGPLRIARLVGADLCAPGLRGGEVRPPPLGRIDQADGLVAVGAAVPLGRLAVGQGAMLAEAGAELVITPWRGVVVPDLPGARADSIAEHLRATGLLLDPGAPGVGVTACTGRPGCAKALADVRTDAAAMIAAGAVTPVPVHWSGCPRRCGRPRGEAIDIVATEDGYTLTREGR